MNVCITGGAGFVGSHLADRLVNDGHNVVVFDNLSTGSYQNPNVVFYNIDISSASVSELTDLLIEHNVEYVFHLAAQINLRKSFEVPVFDAQTNIIGTLNIAQAAECANVKKFIFASTGGAMYSEKDQMPWEETCVPSPQSPYALSKLCSEQYLQLLWPKQTVILRFSNVYGPRQNPHGEAGVISIFTNNIFADLPCVIFGDGRQVRDYIYVDDVVDACVKSLWLTGIYNVSTGIGTDLNSLVLMMLSTTGIKGSVRYHPPKHGEMKKSVLNSYKLQNIIKWAPSVSLFDGLSKTIEWYKNKK